MQQTFQDYLTFTCEKLLLLWCVHVWALFFQNTQKERVEKAAFLPLLGGGHICSHVASVPLPFTSGQRRHEQRETLTHSYYYTTTIE